MRSEVTGDQETYRHRDINTEYRPVNSFCVLQTDKNTSMILDERGIYRSQGEAPEPATPLFNEFLKDYIQKNRLKLDQNIRVEYDFYRQQMYICERSEEHTSELQSLMRISYAVLCLKKQNKKKTNYNNHTTKTHDQVNNCIIRNTST